MEHGGIGLRGDRLMISLYLCLSLFVHCFICIKVRITERRRELMSPRPEQHLAEYHREVRERTQKHTHTRTQILYRTSASCVFLFECELRLWFNSTWTHLLCCKLTFTVAIQLADVLQEVREEVQRDHERKLEQLREDHRRETNNIREKYLDEVSECLRFTFSWRVPSSCTTCSSVNRRTCLDGCATVYFCFQRSSTKNFVLKMKTFSVLLVSFHQV